jgi:DNA (cytosine-5)-methyltransferase 1
LTKIGVIDLFAGPGGLSLGFEKAGFMVVAAVESDPSAAETYEKNFPNTKVLKKRAEETTGVELVETARAKGFERTLIVGGPPCQPYSLANKQNNGNRHPSASAVSHFVRLVEEVRPVAFLFENVVTFQRMDGWDQFIIKLQAIGYSTSFGKLEARNFGVPQNRKRLFMAGFANGTDFDIASLNQQASRYPVVREAISGLPPLPSCGGGSDDAPHPGENPSQYSAALVRGAKRLFNHWSTKHSEEVVSTISCIKPGKSLKGMWNSLPESVRRRFHNFESLHSNIYRRLTWNALSPTIVHVRRAMLLHPTQDRILSVREAARLQSFPDTFRFFGGIHHQYQQVANAVPPLMAECIAGWFKEALSKMEVIA